MKKSDRRQAESDLFDTAENVPNFNTQLKFAGTNNPRHLRVLHALLTSSRRREEIDRIAGCSNGPALIADLRHRGLDVPCVMVCAIDRDSNPVPRGVYALTAADRRKLTRWLSTR